MARQEVLAKSRVNVTHDSLYDNKGPIDATVSVKRVGGVNTDNDPEARRPVLDLGPSVVHDFDPNHRGSRLLGR